MPRLYDNHHDHTRDSCRSGESARRARKTINRLEKNPDFNQSPLHRLITHAVAAHKANTAHTTYGSVSIFFASRAILVCRNNVASEFPACAALYLQAPTCCSCSETHTHTDMHIHYTEYY